MKTLKLKSLWFILFYCCYVIFARSSCNLKIFRKIDNSISEVKSEVLMPKGSNFTLTCRVLSLDNTDSFNGYVAWFLMSRKMNFEIDLSDLNNSAHLIFTNFSADHEGLYICASLKFNIYRKVSVLEMENDTLTLDNAKALIMERNLTPAGLPYEYNFSFSNKEELRKNLQKLGDGFYRDFADRRKDENVNENKKYGSHIYENDLYGMSSNFDSNDYYFEATESADEDLFPIKSVVLVCGVLCFVFLVWVVIHCYKTSNPDSGTVGDSRDDLNRLRVATLPTDPEVFGAADIERPLTHTLVNPLSQLDPPPTYSSSTHNQRLRPVDNNDFGLPPSYDEAVGHKSNGGNNSNRHQNSTSGVM